MEAVAVLVPVAGAADADVGAGADAGLGADADAGLGADAGAGLGAGTGTGAAAAAAAGAGANAGAAAADAPEAGPSTFTFDVQQPAAPEAQALALDLRAAQEWTPQILTLALASLGDIDLPPPAQPTAGAAALAALPTLYFVHALDQAGVLQAADTVAGLWASGAVQVPLPDQGQALAAWWRGRRQRLSAGERQHLLGLVFDPRDFERAMGAVCEALVALADNAGRQDLREEVGLQQAAMRLLELCGARLEGAPLAAATDLLAQARAAVAVLSPRALQGAFGVRDFYALVELSARASGAPAGRARPLAERARSGAAILRWLAQAAAQDFTVDPRAAALQTLMADAQRWLMNSEAAGAAAGAGHEQRRYPVAA